MSRRSAFMLVVLSCAGAPRDAGTPRATEGAGPFASGHRMAQGDTGHAGASINARNAGPSDGRLDVDGARRQMLALINADRAKHGLTPVALEEGAASRAAERHARDMATLGFLGHWGSDGSVPEQRHTEAGGADLVMENALCVVDEVKRALEEPLTIDPKELEAAERMFYEEVPPNDGHRKNILRPSHTHVGLGFATAKGRMGPSGPTELMPLCVVQEFVDRYATYAEIPVQTAPGQVGRLALQADVAKGVLPGGFGVVRLPTQQALPVAELNRRRSYPIPMPEEHFWPRPFKTRLPVEVDTLPDGRQRMRFDLVLGAPGLYEVSTWGKLPGQAQYAIIGLRTVRVR